MNILCVNMSTLRKAQAAGTMLIVLAGGCAVAAAQTRAAQDQEAVPTMQQVEDQHNEHAGGMSQVHHIGAVQATTASITVADQPIVNNAIVVDEVVAEQNGWVVLHTVEANGQSVVSFDVGRVAIKAGRSTNVPVPLSQTFQPGVELIAMLHVDEGTPGTLEFPGGADVAVRVNEQIVETPFTILDAAPTSAVLPDTGAGGRMVGMLLAGALLLGNGMMIRRRRIIMPLQGGSPART